jgi:hypothetical protein
VCPNVLLRLFFELNKCAHISASHPTVREAVTTPFVMRSPVMDRASRRGTVLELPVPFPGNGALPTIRTEVLSSRGAAPPGRNEVSDQTKAAVGSSNP